MSRARRLSWKVDRLSWSPYLPPPFNSDPDIRHKVVGLQRREMEMKVEFVTQERWACSGR